jgi:hypothetical protein
MLNLDHPLTPHVFRASGLIDGVMVRGQRMSVSPSTVRAELLAECLPLFAEMRELACAQFGSRAQFLLQAIAEYELGIRRLAGLGEGQITEDRRDGEGNCPYCGTPIMKFDAFAGSPGLDPHYIILCAKCDGLYSDAKEKLESSDGFGTWAI